MTYFLDQLCEAFFWHALCCTILGANPYFVELAKNALTGCFASINGRGGSCGKGYFRGRREARWRWRRFRDLVTLAGAVHSED